MFKEFIPGGGQHGGERPGKGEFGCGASGQVLLHAANNGSRTLLTPGIMARHCQMPMEND